jgi:hypothetical protein
VGWVLAVWMFLSTLRSPASNFSNGWKSKTLWLLLFLAALIPLIGIAVVMAYVFMERVNFPAHVRPEPEWRGYPRNLADNPDDAERKRRRRVREANRNEDQMRERSGLPPKWNTFGSGRW